MTTGIAQEIEALRQMALPELVVRYRELFGREPRVKHREHLWKRCAWKIQEIQFGGLSDVAKRRLEELIAEIDLPVGEKQRTVAGKLRGTAQPKMPVTGTAFTRQWKGREVRAVAVDGGFECDGVVYKSLTAVALAVTGSHWNGKLFFGLTKRVREAE